MARKERDYSNLRESERVWEAVKMQKTEVKDYSLKHLCSTLWHLTDEQMRHRLVHVVIGDERFVGVSTQLCDAINDLVSKSNDDGWLPRTELRIIGDQGKLLVSTVDVNRECLRDHVARVTIGEKTAIIDLEELLKATRYA